MPRPGGLTGDERLVKFDWWPYGLDGQLHIIYVQAVFRTSIRKGRR